MINSIRQRRNELLGKEFDTNSSGKCFIIDYKGAKDVLVMFYDPVCIVKTRIEQLRDGCVSNVMIPKLYGKGFIGVGKYGHKDLKIYNTWNKMFVRSYSQNYRESFPTYAGVEVCKEWLNFQNFAEWCETQEFFNVKDDKGKVFHLDKDVLVKGNKVYSPETCSFIPSEINSLLTSAKRSRGKYPIGVYYKKGLMKPFVSQVNLGNGQNRLGSFSTPEEAFLAYKTAKEDYIKEVAEKWKGKISDKVYDALMDWEINIDD